MIMAVSLRLEKRRSREPGSLRMLSSSFASQCPLTCFSTLRWACLRHIGQWYDGGIFSPALNRQKVHDPLQNRLFFWRVAYYKWNTIDAIVVNYSIGMKKDQK